LNVSIQTHTNFACVEGHYASMCVYVFVQYDTRTNWRTGEERADRAGVKSEGGCTYGNDAVFDFPSTPCENIHAADGVI